MNPVDTNRLTARHACEEALSTFGADIPSPTECREFLRQVARGSVPKILQGSDPEFICARGVLVSGALSAIDEVQNLPVSDSVKALIYREFESYARPPARWRAMFNPTTVRFQEMARIVSFSRFPAGQMHWEVSGVPLSWVSKAPWPGPARLLNCLWSIRGRHPLWETHVNDRRPNPVVLLESESQQAYLRIADSLRMQAEIRGVMTCSWLYCREIARVSPRLAWLRCKFEESGALLTDLGPAPPDSGFLVGSDERRRLYESGAFRPQMTLVLWPRAEVLRWAESLNAITHK